MTLFNPVFNRQTPKGVKRLKTRADEGLTPADEAGYVVLRQPPASKLANLFRIYVLDHALGLVTQQLGGRVTEHPPGGWLGPRTPSLREGPGSASVLPRQESFASLHILTRRASEGSEALPSLARRVRMSFFGARVIPSGSPDPAAGTGARVLANEPSQLSPESTSYGGR